MIKHLKFIFSTFTMALSLFVSAETLSTGSGTFISSNLVLTAYHVIDGAESITIRTADHNEHQAKLIAGNQSADWAILSVETIVKQWAIIGDYKNIVLGDRVYVLGYPSSNVLGSGVKYSDGSISSISTVDSLVPRFQISAPIQPGNSGGPLFNEYGFLIGFISSTIDPQKYFSITGGALPQNINFAVSISACLQELIRNRCYATNAVQHKVSIAQNQKNTCFIKCSIKNAALNHSYKPIISNIISNTPASLNCGEGTTMVDSIFGCRFGNISAFDEFDKIETDSKCIFDCYSKKNVKPVSWMISLELLEKPVDILRLYTFHGEHRIVAIERIFRFSGKRTCDRAFTRYMKYKELREEIVSLFEKKYEICFVDSDCLTMPDGRNFGTTYSIAPQLLNFNVDIGEWFWPKDKSTYISRPDFYKKIELLKTRLSVSLWKNTSSEEINYHLSGYDIRICLEDISGDLVSRSAAMQDRIKVEAEMLRQKSEREKMCEL